MGHPWTHPSKAIASCFQETRIPSTMSLGWLLSNPGAVRSGSSHKKISTDLRKVSISTPKVPFSPFPVMKSPFKCTVPMKHRGWNKHPPPIFGSYTHLFPKKWPINASNAVGRGNDCSFPSWELKCNPRFKDFGLTPR